MIEQASSVERLIIIEAIEETGNVLFALIARLAREIEARRGIVLRSCASRTSTPTMRSAPWS